MKHEQLIKSYEEKRKIDEEINAYADAYEPDGVTYDKEISSLFERRKQVVDEINKLEKELS